MTREEQIQKAAETFAEIYPSIPHGVVLTEEDKRAVYINGFYEGVGFAEANPSIETLVKIFVAEQSLYKYFERQSINPVAHLTAKEYAQIVLDKMNGINPKDFTEEDKI